jgi:hypothetical protein
MAPTPASAAVWYIGGGARGVIEDLAQMSGFGHQTVYTPWATPLQKLIPQLTVTNISPLVITGYSYRDLAYIERLISLPRLRPLVFCGLYAPPHAQTIPTTDIAALESSAPWRAIGAFILRSWIKDQCFALTRSPT